MNYALKIRNKWTKILASTSLKFTEDATRKNNQLVKNFFPLPNGVEGINFRFHSMGDKGVIQQIFVDYDYSLDHWVQGRALQRYFDAKSRDADALIIDAGANIGAASIYFGNSYPRSKIVAIEPERRNVQILRMNAAERKIEVVSGAVGSKKGKMYLQDPGLSD